MGVLEHILYYCRVKAGSHLGHLVHLCQLAKCGCLWTIGGNCSTWSQPTWGAWGACELRGPGLDLNPQPCCCEATVLPINQAKCLSISLFLEWQNSNQLYPPNWLSRLMLLCHIVFVWQCTNGALLMSILVLEMEITSDGTRKFRVQISLTCGKYKCPVRGLKNIVFVPEKCILCVKAFIWKRLYWLFADLILLISCFAGLIIQNFYE